MPYCKETIVEHDVYISNGAGKVSIGKHCEINEHVFIQGATIGNYVMIAPHVAILNSTHHFNRTDIPMIMQGKGLNMNPVIEDDVWLGRNVVIMPGIRIGKGSIVGAGAIVTRDVPPFSIVGGVPAKILKTRQTG
ncbi:acyltransferase [uncultured Pontibacter sp.]|uniref:acyltransferase n=1 Tax=uncultured Pontibacter sp. TaxID=453356 RepID=UPI00261A2164|nr:acyltransferase [uncultured Pontibacter sp.]